jgi:hypothetical protein
MRKEQIPNVLLQCSSTAVLINTKIMIILLAWIEDDTVCVCVRARGHACVSERASKTERVSEGERVSESD